VIGYSNIKTGLRTVIAMAVLAAAFALPAQAFAQTTNCANAGSDPTAAQYCSVSGVQTGGNGNTPQVTNNGTSGPQVKNVSASSVTPSGTAAVETSSSSGSLPFTGLDVGILLMVAAVLAGTGLALRRLTASGVHKS
jgi:hypothetical protein